MLKETGSAGASWDGVPYLLVGYWIGTQSSGMSPTGTGTPFKTAAPHPQPATGAGAATPHPQVFWQVQVGGGGGGTKAGLTMALVQAHGPGNGIVGKAGGLGRT